MSKLVEVKFSGLYGVTLKYEGQSGWSRDTEYIKSVEDEYRKLVSEGISINVKESASTVRPLLTELMKFPVGEKRFDLVMKTKTRTFISREAAEEYWTKRVKHTGTPLNIQERSL